jgi:hypothetical protein
MSSKETFEKAYGNFNKELPVMGDWDWIPSRRGLKYYYLKMIRFFTR